MYRVWPWPGPVQNNSRKGPGKEGEHLPTQGITVWPWMLKIDTATLPFLKIDMRHGAIYSGMGMKIGGISQNRHVIWNHPLQST